TQARGSVREAGSDVAVVPAESPPSVKAARARTASSGSGASQRRLTHTVAILPTPASLLIRALEGALGPCGSRFVWKGASGARHLRRCAMPDPPGCTSFLACAMAGPGNTLRPLRFLQIAVIGWLSSGAGPGRLLISKNVCDIEQ